MFPSIPDEHLRRFFKQRGYKHQHRSLPTATLPSSLLFAVYGLNIKSFVIEKGLIGSMSVEKSFANPKILVPVNFFSKLNRL